MEVRWQQGISDARTALHASPWRLDQIDTLYVDGGRS
jgi:hypothetical protein